jgi:phenylalanyl-tRNA synthetase alpha subunit
MSARCWRREYIAMLRYGITEIRIFYENDTRFWKQF